MSEEPQLPKHPGGGTPTKAGNMKTKPAQDSRRGRLIAGGVFLMLLLAIPLMHIWRKGPQAEVLAEFGGKGVRLGAFEDLRHFAVDPHGNVYASEMENHRIQKFGPDGQYLLAWTIQEKPSSNYFRESGPEALAADEAGFLYVKWDRSLLKYDGSSGKLVARFPLGDLELGDRMVAFRDTLLAFADGSFDDTLVWISTRDGQVIRKTPKLLSAIVRESLHTKHMCPAVDGSGNILVLYTFPGRHAGIYRFSPEGRYLNRLSIHSDSEETDETASDLAVDGLGRLYVSRGKQIDVFDSQGHLLGNLPYSLIKCLLPNLATDGENHLYVVNTANGVFRKFQLRMK